MLIVSPTPMKYSALVVLRSDAGISAYQTYCPAPAQALLHNSVRESASAPRPKA
jgi:hypothetical protein